MFQCILATTDGSTTAQPGVQQAAGLARALGAQLVLLHVVDQRPVYADFSGVDNTAEMVEVQAAAGQRVLDEARGALAKQGIEVRTRLVACTSESIPEIVLREAKTLACDLIVMGTHGRSGLRNLLMGSVAEAVVHHSTVPVLLVRAPS